MADKFMLRGRGGFGGGKGGGGGGGSTAPSESANTLRSKSTARVLDIVSEGEIKGLVNGANSIYLDGTPLVDEDGKPNFSAVRWAQRRGLPFGAAGQEYVPGFSSVETEVGVGIEVTKSRPATVTITDDNVDAVRVTVKLASLTFQKNDGSLIGDECTIAFHVKPANGEWYEALRNQIVGKQTSEYLRAYRIELPAGGAPWSIRMERISNDPGTVQRNNKSYFQSYTKLTDAKMTYPHTAYFTLEMDAQAFAGRIPQRAYDVYGLIIKVPSNYNPTTREYSGIWDGTFKLDWTDNPAWILYDVITSERYGIGDFIDAASVDKWGLYEIGRYCDELVPDGFGGTEPRYTFNYTINTQSDVFRLLQSMASSFLGLTYWSAGSVMFAQDRPADPVQLVTNANVIDGEFNYSGTAIKSRHNVVTITWNNPDDGDAQDLETVEEPEDIAQYGPNETSFLAMGTKSRGGARRRGRWVIETERSEDLSVSYRASFDHLECLPGEIIAVQDRDFAEVDRGGRTLDNSTTTNIVLDRPVTIAAGQTYQLYVALPSGDVEYRDVVNGEGTYSTLTVSPAFTRIPLTGAVWALSGSDVSIRLFRVMAIKETEPNIVEISALVHDPNKYARIENDTEFVEKAYFASYPRGKLPPPTDLVVTEELYKVNQSTMTRILLTWTGNGDPRTVWYAVQYRYNNGNWQDAGITSSVSMELEGQPDGEYAFSVKAFWAAGESVPLELMSVIIEGKTAEPANVENFRATRKVDGVQLEWDEVKDIDVVGYEIRDGLSWDGPEAIVVTTQYRGTSLFRGLDDANIHRFHIRAVDELGLYSALPTTIDASVIPPPSLTRFEAVPNDGQIQFFWDEVEGLGNRYEVTRGDEFATSNFIGLFSGDRASRLLPAVGAQTYWVRALSVANLYSPQAISFRVGINALTPRNIVLSQDQHPTWAGYYHGLSVVANKLQFAAGEARLVGDYFATITHPYEINSRCWYDGVLEAFALGIQWQDATFAWNSLNAQIPWQTGVDLDGSYYECRIAFKDTTLAANLIDGWTFNNTQTSLRGVSPTLSIETAYAIGFWHDGLLVTDLTSWGASLALVAPWNHRFVVRLSEELTDGEALMLITGPSRWMKLRYDNEARKFDLLCSDGNTISVSPSFVGGDTLAFAIVQTTTERRLYCKVMRTEVSLQGSGAFAPPGDFSTVYLFDNA